MKVLIVSHFHSIDPSIASAGVYQRLAMFAQALGDTADLSVLLFVGDDVDRSELGVQAFREELERHWRVTLKLSLVPNGLWDSRLSQLHSSIASFFDHSVGVMSKAPSLVAAGKAQISGLEKCLLDAPDLLFAHRLSAMAPLVRLGAASPKKLSLQKHDVPAVLFDLDDIEHVSFGRQLERPWLVRRLGTYLLRRAQRRATAVASNVCVTSHDDKRRLLSDGSTDNVTVIPNSVIVPELVAVAEIQDSAPPVLLYLGTYDYGPNAVAADWLISRVWPAVHGYCPQAELIIAGRNPEKIDSYARQPNGVTFSGFVEELSTLYSRVTLVCCPIQSGSGTRIKILEAAAYMRPVVSTTVGAEGLQLRNEQDLLIRDEAEQFADACWHLIRSPERARSLAQAARNKVEALYSRGAAHAAVQAVVTDALSAKNA